MQRYLGRFADRATEQQERDKRVGVNIVPDDIKGHAVNVCQIAENIGVMNTAKCKEYQNDTEAETEVAEPVDDERLLARVGGGFFLIVVSDQEV